MNIIHPIWTITSRGIVYYLKHIFQVHFFFKFNWFTNNELEEKVFDIRLYIFEGWITLMMILLVFHLNSIPNPNWRLMLQMCSLFSLPTSNLFESPKMNLKNMFQIVDYTPGCYCSYRMDYIHGFIFHFNIFPNPPSQIFMIYTCFIFSPPMCNLLSQ